MKKIIIDIPDEMYKRITKAPRCVSDLEAFEDRTTFCKAIQNGVVIEGDPYKDIISRRELNNKIEMLDRRYGNDFYWEVKGIIDKLPSVYPKQKTAHWETRNIFPNWLYCSECDEPYGLNDRPRYCPNCGARMVEPRESEGEE